MSETKNADEAPSHTEERGHDDVASTLLYNLFCGALSPIRSIATHRFGIAAGAGQFVDLAAKADMAPEPRFFVNFAFRKFANTFLCS